MPTVVFDLDGVIYVGARLLPHVAPTLERLRASGWDVCFATNGTTRTREGYRDRLGALGVDVDTAHIVSGASATAATLAGRDVPPRDVLVVGTDDLRAELRQAGLSVRAAGVPHAADPVPDVVVVGLDPDFTYEKLAEAQHAVLRGAELVAGNRDGAYPAEGRLWPGAGPIVAAIETASGRAATCIGKPEPFLFQEAVRSVRGTPPVVVVGDSPASDIVAAHRAGAVGVLVLSGMTGERELADARGDAVPDHVIHGLDELFDLAPFAGASRP